MRRRHSYDRALELAFGAVALILTTLACLIASPAVGALALVSGGISYGVIIARRNH